MPNVRCPRPARLALGAILGSLVFAGMPGAFAQEIIDTPRGPGLLIYGNYCGPGNRGPAFAPIDALDLACKHHDMCWPEDQGALPACSCNERLHVEAGRVARDPRMPAKTRDTAKFISDLATAIPCQTAAAPGIVVPGAPRRPAIR